MQVAVYAIAKNEKDHVARWAESAAEADDVILVDTGSRDGTIGVARKAGVTVEKINVNPWRFDVARNMALDLVPGEIDYCIALDLDEVLVPGWRAALETAAEQHLTRPRYRYTWSWNPDGTPGLIYGGDKIHRRHGYRWRHPVHEVLRPVDVDETQGWIDLEIHHYPDSTKSRGSYMPLLKLSVDEDPDDDRNAFYYARELMYAGQGGEAATEFRRHLALPTAVWAPERSASMRYLAACEPDQRETWLLRAAAEAPWHREAWVALAELYYERGDWPSCFGVARRALTIREQPLEYLNEADAWGSKPHDMAALAAHHLGLQADAIVHGLDAISADPTDDRLRANLGYYEGDLTREQIAQLLLGRIRTVPLLEPNLIRHDVDDVAVGD